MKKILSAALALVCVWFATPAHAALPSGYTELKYIESTGTQYIDTGITPTKTNNTKVEFELQLTVTTSGEAQSIGTNNNIHMRADTLFFRANASTLDVPLDTAKHRVVLQQTSAGRTYQFDNLSGTGSVNEELANFHLFRMNGTSVITYGYYRLYYTKIWDNNTLVRNFVPAKDSSGKIGMYDTVTNTFFTNAGTGEFIAGPVVENNTCTKNGFGFANESIIYNVGANFLDNYSAESGRRLTYSDETAVCAVTGSGSASNGFIGSQTVVFTSGHKYATIAYLNATGRFNIGLTRISPSDSVTGGTSSSMQEATNGWTWSALPLNAVVDGTAVINARISTGVLQVKEMYLIDLTALFGAGNEPTTKSEIIAAFTTNPCPSSIKIATTKYNETAFGPLNTALANAISVVDSVVTQTITQAASIATLQTQKQTRPNDIADDNEKCPAGKKCLLVEDASGVPHWYEIVENAWDLPAGYTQLEYIESTGTQYIDTGVMLGRDHINTDIKLEYDALIKQNSTSWQVCGTLGSDGIYIGVNGSNIIYYGTGILDTSTGVRNPFVKCKYINDGKNGIVKVTNLLTNIDIVNLTYTPITKETILPMILFGFSTNETSISSFRMSADMYNAKIYDKDILIRNFIPAKRNSDNVIGMYDTVNNRFYTNAGDGEFIAGPVVQ